MNLKTLRRKLLRKDSVNPQNFDYIKELEDKLKDIEKKIVAKNKQIETLENPFKKTGICL